MSQALGLDFKPAAKGLGEVGDEVPFDEEL